MRIRIAELRWTRIATLGHPDQAMVRERPVEWPLLFAFFFGIALAPGEVRAQEHSPVTVQPGEASTIIAQFALGDRTSARYTITPAEGFQLLGATHGMLPPDESGVARLPISFVTPVNASAGPSVVARVSVQWPGGGPHETEIRVEIARVRNLRLELAAPEPTVRRDAANRFAYSLINEGNATDTVHLETIVGGDWTPVEPIGPHVLAPMDSVVGHFALRVPADAKLGEQRLLRMRTGSAKGDASASVALTVVDRAARTLGQVQLPASVFIGGTSGGTELSASLVGSGFVGPETEVGFELRHVGSGIGPAPGQSALWGPRALLSLRHQDLQGALGEMAFPMDGIARGIRPTGIGLQVEEGGEGWRGGAVIARPRSWFGEQEGGHLLQAELGHRVGAGAVSARVMEFAGDGTGVNTEQKEQILGLRYALAGQGRHRLSVEAGVLREAPDHAESTSGTALDARYRYMGSRGSLGASFRRVPEQRSATLVAGDETALHGSVMFLPRLWGSASAHLAALPAGIAGEARGVSTGLQLRGLRSSLGVTGAVRETRSDTAMSARRRESVAAALRTSVGPIALSGSVEAGKATGPTTGSGVFHRWHGQIRWSRNTESFWVGMDGRSEPLYTSPLQVQMGTRITIGSLAVDAMAGASVRERRLAPAFLRLETELAVSKSVSLVAGADYRASLFGYSPPTISFGIRKDLRLPLPLRERPAFEGVVFEDRNGNGRRDSGEPGVEGVAVAAASARMTTNRRGEFATRIKLSPGTPVRLHLGAMTGEYLAPSVETIVPESGRVELPVVRPAAVDLAVFDDQSGDGVFGSEDVVPSAAVFVLKGPGGRTYSRAADSAGRARLAAVVPGEYLLLVQQQWRTLTKSTLILPPGAEVSYQAAVRTPTREIRMWTPDS